MVLRSMRSAWVANADMWCGDFTPAISGFSAQVQLLYASSYSGATDLPSLRKLPFALLLHHLSAALLLIIAPGAPLHRSTSRVVRELPINTGSVNPVTSVTRITGRRQTNVSRRERPAVAAPAACKSGRERHTPRIPAQPTTAMCCHDGVGRAPAFGMSTQRDRWPVSPTRNGLSYRHADGDRAS